MVDAGMTQEYETWFAQRWPVPLTDPDIPVPRRQEDFPLTGEEGDDEDEEDEDDEDGGDGGGEDDDEEDEEDDGDRGEDGDEDDEDDEEPDSVDQETLQDIPIEPETARTEELDRCRATIASQQDYIVTLERQNTILKTERDTTLAQAQREGQRVTEFIGSIRDASAREMAQMLVETGEERLYWRTLYEGAVPLERRAPSYRARSRTESRSRSRRSLSSIGVSGPMRPPQPGPGGTSSARHGRDEEDRGSTQ